MAFKLNSLPPLVPFMVLTILPARSTTILCVCVYQELSVQELSVYFVPAILVNYSIDVDYKLGWQFRVRHIRKY